MTKQVKDYANKMQKYVVEYLIDEYNIDDFNASKMVQQSSFNKLLEDNPEYVMHFNVEYWGDRVKSEYDKIRQYAYA